MTSTIERDVTHPLCSGGSVLATLEAADDVQRASLL